jgi:hypothetical protein
VKLGEKHAFNYGTALRYKFCVVKIINFYQLLAFLLGRYGMMEKILPASSDNAYVLVAFKKKEGFLWKKY